MASISFPPQVNALAKTLVLQEHLWQRPQVQGITIDGPDSRDLDDAIWIEPLNTGAIFFIHIADVSELIKIDSILDNVAIEREETRFFSSGYAPMLPLELSEDKLSLLEGKPRPTLTVKVTLNQRAEIEQSEIFESWLIAGKNLNHEQCNEILSAPSLRHCHVNYHAYYSMLKLCQIWVERLSKQRTGIVDWENHIPTVSDLDENMSCVKVNQQYHSQTIVQTFMVLANRAMTRWLTERKLYALKRSSYYPFTSPIRRVPDLINHRIVKASLRGEESPYSGLEVRQFRKHFQQTVFKPRINAAKRRKSANKKPEVKPIHPILVKRLKDGQNFVRLLAQLCGSLKWPTPGYEFTELDKGFSCECHVTILNEPFSGISTAKKKQRAKHLAARMVLEQLQEKMKPIED